MSRDLHAATLPFWNCEQNGAAAVGLAAHRHSGAEHDLMSFVAAASLRASASFASTRVARVAPGFISAQPPGFSHRSSGVQCGSSSGS